MDFLLLTQLSGLKEKKQTTKLNQAKYWRHDLNEKSTAQNSAGGIVQRLSSDKDSPKFKKLPQISTHFMQPLLHISTFLRQSIE